MVFVVNLTWNMRVFTLHSWPQRCPYISSPPHAIVHLHNMLMIYPIAWRYLLFIRLVRSFAKVQYLTIALRACVCVFKCMAVVYIESLCATKICRDWSTKCSVRYAILYSIYVQASMYSILFMHCAINRHETLPLKHHSILARSLVPLLYIYYRVHNIIPPHRTESHCEPCVRRPQIML